MEAALTPQALPEMQRFDTSALPCRMEHAANTTAALRGLPAYATVLTVAPALTQCRLCHATIATFTTPPARLLHARGFCCTAARVTVDDDCFFLKLSALLEQTWSDTITNVTCSHGAVAEMPDVAVGVCRPAVPHQHARVCIQPDCGCMHVRIGGRRGGTAAARTHHSNPNSNDTDSSANDSDLRPAPEPTPDAYSRADDHEASAAFNKETASTKVVAAPSP